MSTSVGSEIVMPSSQPPGNWPCNCLRLENSRCGDSISAAADREKQPAGVGAFGRQFQRPHPLEFAVALAHGVRLIEQRLLLRTGRRRREQCFGHAMPQRRCRQ